MPRGEVHRLRRKYKFLPLISGKSPYLRKSREETEARSCAPWWGMALHLLMERKLYKTQVLFIIYTIKEQQLNQAVSASQMLRWTLTCPAYAVLRSTPALPKSNHPTEQSSCASIIPAFGKWRQEDEVMVTLSNLQNLKPSLNNTRQNKTKVQSKSWKSCSK